MHYGRESNYIRNKLDPKQVEEIWNRAKNRLFSEYHILSIGLLCKYRR